MEMAGIAIGVRPRRATGETIQAIIAIGLLVGGNGRAGGSRATVVTTRGRASVAVPHEAAQVVVTVGLVVGECPTTLRGKGGGETQHVANAVIATRLAEEGLVLPGHGRAFRQGTLDAVIALRCAEERIGRRDRFGSGAAQRQTGHLPSIGVADLSHQEGDRRGFLSSGSAIPSSRPLSMLLSLVSSVAHRSQPGRFVLPTTATTFFVCVHLLSFLPLNEQEASVHPLLPARCDRLAQTLLPHSLPHNALKFLYLAQ
jgi:hypothetical protein